MWIYYEETESRAYGDLFVVRGLTRGAYVVPLVDGTLKALTFPKLPVGSGTIALRQSDLKKTLYHH